MIQRATAAHADYINEIANDPNVNPHIGGEKDMDLSDLLGESISFVTEGGAIIFTPVNAAVYQFHTMFVPEARGRHALKAARHSAFEMFTTTDAMELVTYTPDEAKHARPPRTFGFKPWFGRKNAIWGKDTTWYRLHINDWVVRDDGCLKKGQKFHRILHEQQDESHIDDDVHDRFVGAAIAMAEAGKVDKGLMVYNSWAGCAGYHAAVVESYEPLRVFTGDAVWSLVDGKLECELCQ